MSDTDCAIVVGVWLYPGLTNLSGPENDAVAFADWLRRPGPGDVPPARVKLILSSDFARPGSVVDAMPTRDRIEAAFDGLEGLAQENKAQGKGLRVGRRLYLYFAGHGFAPLMDESALLMANATQRTVRYHIAGKSWANWFYKAAYFDEVVLFMDCCRENYPSSPINPVGYGEITGASQAKRFFGFGTKWRKVSWERQMPDGKTHGVFTTALLSGLRGAAADTKTGLVTASSLRNYLLNRMKDFLSSQDLQNPDIEKEPDVNDPDNAGDTMVFAQVTPPKYPVNIKLPAGSEGRTINVLDSSFRVVDSTIATGPACTVPLTRGTYMVEIAGDVQKKVFDVRGSEPVPPGISVVL
jgi:hypothetical protein